MPFLATMPMTMISPMNDDTLNVVRVTSSARKTPEVERIADDRMATGGGERSELEQQHQKDQDDRQHQHEREIAERLLLLLVRAAVLDANRRRQLQVGDRLLHRRDAGAQVDALRAAPSLRPRRCRFSRRTSVWPGSSSIARQRVRASPSRPTSSRASCCSSPRATTRSDAGKRTRSGYGRSLMITGAVAGSPSTIAMATVPSSSAREAGARRASED